MAQAATAALVARCVKDGTKAKPDEMTDDEMKVQIDVMLLETPATIMPTYKILKSGMMMVAYKRLRKDRLPDSCTSVRLVSKKVKRIIAKKADKRLGTTVAVAVLMKKSGSSIISAKS